MVKEVGQDTALAREGIAFNRLVKFRSDNGRRYFCVGIVAETLHYLKIESFRDLVCTQMHDSDNALQLVTSDASGEYGDSSRRHSLVTRSSTLPVQQSWSSF